LSRQVPFLQINHDLLMAHISRFSVLTGAAMFFSCGAFVLPRQSIAQPHPTRPIVIRPLAPAAQSLLTRWSRLLRPSANAKISEAASSIGSQLRSHPSSTDPVQLARKAAASQFPNLSGMAIEDAVMLIMMTVAQDAEQDMHTIMNQMEQRRRQKAGKRDSLDSLGDMNQQDQLLLQQMMDQRSQLEQAISNMMKAASDSRDAIVSNLK
jgi:hypothetical protein